MNELLKINDHKYEVLIEKIKKLIKENTVERMSALTGKPYLDIKIKPVRDKFCEFFFPQFLEKKAAKYVLENIRASYGNTAGLVIRAASFEEDTGLDLTLTNFLDYYHIDPRSIYKFASFSRICARADVIDDFNEPTEEMLTKAMAKLMDDLKLEGKVLFVTSEVRENLYLGIRNLGYADVVMAEDLSILDIVNSDTIVFEESAIKYIEEAFN